MTEELMSEVDVAALERSLESALMPGTYIDWRAKRSFMDALYVVEHEVEQLANVDAAAGAAVYESFIAAINAKMDEFDDDGDIGMLISSLYIGWIKARVASGAPAHETAARLAWWIEHDD